MKNGRNIMIRAVIILTSWAWLLSTSANAGLWWESLTTNKYKEDIGFHVGYGTAGGPSPHYWNKDESDQFLFCPLAVANGAPAALYSIPALRAALSSNDVAPIVYGNNTNLYVPGVPWKGGAVSDDLGRVLTGSGGGPQYASLPVTSPWTTNVTVFSITNTPANVVFDGLDFSHTSEYLYSDFYNSGSRSNIYKWNVVNLTNNGVGLTSNSVFTTSITRIRNLSVYYIGGKDLVYYGEGGNAAAGGKVCVWDTVTSNETVLCAVGVLNTNDIVNVKAGGIGLGQMHLYVQHDNGTLEILNLAADGKSATTNKTFTVAEMYNILGATWPFDGMRSFEVTDDEQYAFFSHYMTNVLYVVWSTAPGIAVLGTNGAVVANGGGASPANGTDFGSFTIGVAPVTNTFAVTNNGNGPLAISGWTTNGTGASAFSISNLGFPIAAGGVSNFTIIFNPSVAGTHTASVAIANDSSVTSYVVNLAGTVIKQNQAITNFTPTNGSAFATTSTVHLSAQASSGLAVSFTNIAGSPVTWQNSTTITFSASGTVSIVASQAGDTVWNVVSKTNSFNVTKISQTITFPAIADQPVTSSVTLAATASSGLPMSFAVGAGPGTIGGGSNLTFSATGIVSIVASQAGNSRWNAAPNVTNSFVVYDNRQSVSSGVCADYDGDGLADPAIYDEATGTWKIRLSSANYYLITTTLNGLGGPGYASVSADYDGDGLADPAVYQEQTGRWIIALSKTDYTVTVTLSPTLGGIGYSGMPADYDGDTKSDPGVYQREFGDWKILLSSSDYYEVDKLGLLGGTGYRAVAADYDGDRKADPAIYGESNGYWIFKLSSIGYVEIPLPQTLGGSGYIPVPADYDGDGLADPAVRSATGNDWIVMLSTAGYTPMHLPLSFD